MARKSRKNTGSVIEAPVQISNYFSTAIYVRLSIENSGKDDDGDSIANQISFCKAYLAEHTDLKLYGIYEDNGEKGTNFDRPAFKRMMDDIRGGKVKCVLVKDLSRFGRDYIEAGEYLEKIFPFMGIRFISITDGYDSLNCDDAEGALMIPLKNMINDVYAKDISRKIITSFRARQEKGEFLPAFAPYGYVKSKKVAYRYEIDQETAPYVTVPGRFEFVFTPKHGSWLNLVEGFFSKLTRQMLKGIRVKTKDELVQRIFKYFDEVNEDPVVYHWKYKLEEIDSSEAVEVDTLQIKKSS